MTKPDDYRGKRVFDVVVGSMGLVVLSPLLTVLSVLVRVTSTGPAWHRSLRVGRHGGLFTLYKIRTMRRDASDSGPAITARGDPRVTAVGRFLRRTKLDELPQLINVVRGDMSIVGPRPEDPKYVATYDDHERHILRWRPGITSPASVTYRDEEAVLAPSDNLDAVYRRVAAEKIRIDLGYFPTATLTTDITWMGKTALAVVSRGVARGPVDGP